MPSQYRTSTAKWTGMEDLFEKLRQFSRDFGVQGSRRTPIHKAFRTSGVPMRDAARARAPAGRTGTLRRSISFGRLPASVQNRLMSKQMIGYRVFVRQSSRSQGTAYYAHMVEFGTSSPIVPKRARVLYDKEQGISFGTSVRGQAAQPFMRSTVAEQEAQYFARFKQVLSTEIDKWVKKHGAKRG